MPAYRFPRDLNERQAQTLEQAALLILNARNEAGALLERSGVERPPEGGWFGSPCGVTLPPPPQHHRCGCRNYKGDGGPCMTQYRDFTGPELGSGAPLRTCGHLPSDHLET